MTLKLKAIVIRHPPWLYGNHPVNCRGILCDLIKYLTKSLNSTYTLIEAHETGTFVKSNNSWTGSLGQLQRNVFYHG